MPRAARTIEQQIARLEYRRRERRQLGQFRVNHIAEHGPPAHDVAARRAEIPPDTRTLTGLISGDPLPGRSALDQRGAAFNG